MPSCDPPIAILPYILRNRYQVEYKILNRFMKNNTFVFTYQLGTKV